ncbi:rhodanese-like domain-containing protein [Candidatus Amarolinea dominans]|uniref:rhodanese-like domain-containing protein n=1 Tax=Candidatus Amarolinea dominans TaxID=3140696 RepID=UPI003136FE0A|nr:hypothetical protein [Anaerolineae bacterium]
MADIAQTGTIAAQSKSVVRFALTYLADNEVPESWRDPRLADRSRPIITTCILGPLGAIGGKLLHDMGFTNVQILEGGVRAIRSKAGLPVVKQNWLMTAANVWGISGNWAEICKACFVPSVIAPWAGAHPGPGTLPAGQRLLDVACGTSEVTRRPPGL